MPLPCDDDLHQHTTYRTSLSLLLSHQTYPKVARLASLLPPSPLRIRGTADSQAADHVSCAATPARKRDTRLAAAGFRPPSQISIYIYIDNNIYRSRSTAFRIIEWAKQTAFTLGSLPFRREDSFVTLGHCLSFWPNGSQGSRQGPVCSV